jgi:hypothetical protein
METGVVLTPKLTGAECELLIEMLEAECRRLPAEIHHTHSGEFKEHLRRRLDTAEGLLERLKIARNA